MESLLENAECSWRLLADVAFRLNSPSPLTAIGIGSAIRRPTNLKAEPPPMASASPRSMSFFLLRRTKPSFSLNHPHDDVVQSIDKQTAKSISAANMGCQDRLDERISKSRRRISHLTSGALMTAGPTPREPADMSLNLHAEHTRGTSPQQRRSCPFSSPSRWILVGSVRVPRAPRALVSIPWAPHSSSAKRFQHGCGCVVAILPGSRLPGDRWYPPAVKASPMR